MARFNPARCFVLLVIGIAISALPFCYSMDYWVSHHAFPANTGDADEQGGWGIYSCLDGNIEYAAVITHWPEKPNLPNCLQAIFINKGGNYQFNISLPTDNFWRIYKPMPERVRICLRKTINWHDHLSAEEMLIFTDDNKKELLIWCGPRFKNSSTNGRFYAVPR